MPPWPQIEETSGETSGETTFSCAHTQDQQGGQGPTTRTYGPPQLKVFLKALVCGRTSAGVAALSPLLARTAPQTKPRLKQQTSAMAQCYETEDNTCNKQLKHLLRIPDVKRMDLQHCIKYKF